MMPNRAIEISVRDAMITVAPGQSLFAALREVKIASFETLIRPDGTLPRLVLEDGSAPFRLADAAQLKARLDEEKVDVCALLLATDFGGKEAEKHTQWAIEAVRAAQELGAGAVRIDTASSNRELSPAELREACVRRISEVLEATAGNGVALGIENHGHISNDPAWLDATFDAVGDPRLGLTLDVGNLYWWGHPLEELYGVIASLAPRARHTHFKNIAYPPEMREKRREVGFEYARYHAPVNQGDIDMARVVGLLQSAGYQGTLCLENEFLGELTPAERAATTRREAQWLREVQGF